MVLTGFRGRDTSQTFIYFILKKIFLQLVVHVYVGFLLRSHNYANVNIASHSFVFKSVYYVGVISCEESHMTNVGFLSYVVEWTERMAEELFYPYKVVGNIMAAIALEHQLMEESVESLRVKRVKGVEDSSQCGSICSAMNSVITSLCLCQLSGEE